MNEITDAKAAFGRGQARTSLPDVSAPLGWLRGEIDRLFDDFGRPAGGFFDFAARGVAPALEMTDQDKEYRLTAELPGLTDKDVELQLSDGLLTLSGDKKMEEERKEGGYLLRERRYGAFKRQIMLPADADPHAIKARFKDGVLTITIAKDEKTSPSTRKIAIED